MKLYNTLTRTVQEFHPLDGKTVRMYVCGPTVYDDPHIGHARSAYIFDVLRRYLEFKGFQVRFVRNVTDVDDKIIEKARQELVHSPQSTVHSDLKTACAEVAEKYLQRYRETMDRLGIARPDIEPKATERVLPGYDQTVQRHIPGMTDLISELLLKGVAYEAGGDVYFSVRKFPDYGKLSKQSLDDLKGGARVQPGEHKDDPLDFALWKAAKPGEPSWKSPWGEGRPGWHIECSLMSTAYLGDEFDIHGGGVDLVFPHHENEVAQAQAAGKPFARFWVHNGLLTVNGDKMSKSLGNYVTVEQALRTCENSVDVLKMFFLSTHYRSPLDFTLPSLKAAESRLYNVLYFFAHTDNFRDILSSQSENERLRQLEGKFIQAMTNDLNTPQALAVIDELVNYGKAAALVYSHIDMGTKELAEKGLQLTGLPKPNTSLEEDRLAAGRLMMSVADTTLRLGKVLGLFQSYKRTTVPPLVKELVGQREIARKSKNYQQSDEIRKQIHEMGFIVADTSGGPVVLPKPSP